MIRLEEITIINAPIERCFDLARSVEVHLIANIHSGEQALAIGGITIANVASCFSAGASGIAAIHLFQDSADPASVVRTIRQQSF